jgi:5-methyltetrahydropteroyltriglutamate--homocysteine methyltransferase
VAIKIFAYQHGIYPRSEQVVAATRGLDRGRVDRAAVDAAFAEDLASLVRAQKDAGLDFFSDGLLAWQDIFRPLMEGLGPIKPEPLVRWFDTNTFFREPDLSGRLPALTGLDGILPDGSLPRPRIATLPSPYMFSRAARTDRDRNRLMVELAQNVLRPAAQAAVKAGAELVHLEEPWLTYVGIQAGDWGPLEEALGKLRQNLQASLVFHTYFGDAAPHIERLRKLPVDAIGVDLVETDMAALGSNWDQALVAGVMNGRSSILESAEATAELARHLADRVSPRNLYLSSTCELGFLPTSLAERKIQRLGEAASLAKELVSV